MPKIETRIEAARGCGYRKKGGIYIVGGKLTASCGMFPIPLTVCPCCGAGIKPSRGWTWVSDKLLEGIECKSGACNNCDMIKNNDRFGLLWIGEEFYQRPTNFIQEAAMRGISRRLSGVPRDFIVGKTVVLLAHRKAITKYNEKMEPEFTPAVFAAFIPSAIEYIVTGEESPGRLDDLAKRGFKLVNVIRDIDAQLNTEDQLQKFDIRYSIIRDGQESHLMVTVHAIDKKTAVKNFKKSFPGAKIISK